MFSFLLQFILLFVFFLFLFALLLLLLLLLLFEIKIYTLIHIRQCKYVSDKKNFQPANFREQGYFFTAEYRWGKVLMCLAVGKSLKLMKKRFSIKMIVDLPHMNLTKQNDCHIHASCRVKKQSSRCQSDYWGGVCMSASFND